ncbi:hypothetical protein EB001_26335, partial [bacterium]|nr:hypothetical protein [bacterium]
NVLQGVGNLRSNVVYDSDSNQPAQNQYATFGATTYTANATYNTPTGITSFDSVQSSKTVAVYTPVDSSNNTVIGGFPSSGVASLSMSAGELSNTTIDNVGNVTSTTSGVNKYNYDVAQNVCGYVNGPQTPKPSQPPLEVWNKLRFWFNDDVRLSIPSVSIPYGQRFITINLNDADNLLSESPSIFLESIQKVNVLPTIVSMMNYSTMAGSVTILGGTATISLNIGATPFTFSTTSFNAPGTGAGTYSITTHDCIQYNTVNDRITFGIVGGGGYIDIGGTVYTGTNNITPGNNFSFDDSTFSANFAFRSGSTVSFSLMQAYTGISRSVIGYFTGTVTSTPQSITTSNISNVISQPTPSQEIKTYTPIYNKFGVTAPKVLAMELYVNNIFVNPEIHDIFIRRIGFALIRVYRQQKSTVSKTNMELLLSSLK